MRKAIIAAVAAMTLVIVIGFFSPPPAAAQETARTSAPVQDKAYINSYGPIVGALALGFLVGCLFAPFARTVAPGAQKSVRAAPPEQEEGYLNSYIALLKTDVSARKTAIITESLSLNAKDFAAFSPVYKRYETDSIKFNQDRLKLIKDYANHYDQMSDAKAGELAERMFALEEQRVGLKRAYLKQFENVLPGRKVARFFQLEHRINLLVDLQIASEVPITK